MTARYMSAAVLRDLEAGLTPRDYAVLQRVSALRFVSGSQLTRLCFPDEPDKPAQARAARRTLLRLTRWGVLARLPRQIGGVRAGSAGFVYHLGPGGLRLAVLRGWQPDRRTRRSLIPGTLFVRHSLLIAELHTRLIEAERQQRFELLTLAAEPSCHRLYDGHSGERHNLKPDSFVRLGLGDYEDSYFVEVDRGTEGSRAIERQLAAYAAYYLSGVEQAEYGVFPRVLWLAPDDRRVGVIADCVARRPATERELFQVARFDQALAVMVPEHGRQGNGII